MSMAKKVLVAARRHVPQDMRRRVRSRMVLAQRLLAAAGIGQSESAIARDSEEYWRSPDEGWWASNSHWRDSPAFARNDLWDRIGKRHLELLETVTGVDGQWGRVVEWGCGGGANAVHVAPRCAEFVGVDVAAESLKECGRQVDAVCGTPFTPVLIDVAAPERALAEIGSPCEVFLSFYVFELLPSPEYGRRILRIAAELLAPGGHVLVQVKYDDGTWRTRSRRWSYSFGVGDMTTYPIARFWEMATECGLEPESVRLRPRDELDERYAYFHLRKPGA